jgi:hypothetical protein
MPGERVGIRTEKSGVLTEEIVTFPYNLLSG